MSQKKQILCEKSYDERVLQDFELEEGDGQGEERFNVIRDSVTLVLTWCF
jgi:hypothetical protein